MKDSLFTLCKQVHEVTGWKLPISERPVEYWVQHDDEYDLEYGVVGLPIDGGIIPLYTSDYLLEKLPYKIGKANSAIWLRLGKTRKGFTVCYMGSDLVWLYEFEADTVPSALLKLTLKLHEEGLL